MGNIGGEFIQVVSRDGMSDGVKVIFQRFSNLLVTLLFCHYPR